MNLGKMGGFLLSLLSLKQCSHEPSTEPLMVWTCIFREESIIAKYLGVNFVEMIVEVLIKIDTFSKRASINS